MSLERIVLASEIQYQVLSHWHPNLTLNVVYDHTPWVPGQVRTPLTRTYNINHFPPLCSQVVNKRVENMSQS